MNGAPSGAPLPFGAVAGSYRAGRPDYPAALYQALFTALNLSPGQRGFEIGAGTGLATVALRARGLDLLAIEPDPRMAAVLRQDCPGVPVLETRLEAADLAPHSFDFGVSAMAMHWLDPAVALPKVRTFLKPGGGFAMWWTVFGDPANPDAFQRESGALFAGQGRFKADGSGTPYALQIPRRLAELTGAGFKAPQAQRFDWQCLQSTAQVLDLTRSFSPVLQMEPAARQALLAGMADLVDNRFGGSVLRNFVSVLYTARAPLNGG